MKNRRKTQARKSKRQISFTDAEWRDIGARATACGSSKSGYVAALVLNKGHDRQATSATLQATMAHKMILHTLDRLCADLPPQTDVFDTIALLKKLTDIQQYQTLALSLALDKKADAT